MVYKDVYTLEMRLVKMDLFYDLDHTGMTV